MPWPTRRAQPTPQVTEMVQQYPQLEEAVKALQVTLREQTAALETMRASSTATPTQIRNLDTGVKDLRAKTVIAMTSFYALRDQWREAIAEARRQGSINAADFSRLQAAGLAGLGVLFVIGWPLAAAIAAVLAPAAFVAAWSLTSESRAAAQATADQNAAMIVEWNRRATGGDFVGPLPPMIAPPGVENNSTVSSIARAASGAGLGLAGIVALGAVAWWFMNRRKGK